MLKKSRKGNWKKLANLKMIMKNSKKNISLIFVIYELYIIYFINMQAKHGKKYNMYFYVYLFDLTQNLRNTAVKGENEN